MVGRITILQSGILSLRSLFHVQNLNSGRFGVTGHQSEIIELALTYGFGGMDLNSVEFATRIRLKGVEYARRLIDSGKMKVGNFPLPLDWDTDDEAFAKDLAKLPEYAQAAVSAGCTRCIATVAPASDKRPYHENFEFHKRRFQEICRTLEPAGVRFGVGFQAAEYLRKNQAFQFVHDLDSLMLLINMAGARTLACCWTSGISSSRAVRWTAFKSCQPSRSFPSLWPTWLRLPRMARSTTRPGCCPAPRPGGSTLPRFWYT